MTGAALIPRKRCGPRAVASAVLGILVAISSSVASADEPTQSAGAEAAAVGAAVRDDLMVPLANTGFSAALGAEYLGEVGPGVLDVTVRLGAGTGWDRVGAQALVIEDGIGVRYYLPTRDLGAWHNAVGPAAGVEADVFYLGDWDDSHDYWMGARWIGTAARTWRPLAHGWRMDGAGEVGLLGLVGRPPAMRENKQDPNNSLRYLLLDVYDRPELAWPGNWQLIRLRVEVSKGEGASLIAGGWRLGGEARLARIDDPAPAFAVQLKLVVARRWTW
jgi:hypothetical protein